MGKYCPGCGSEIKEGSKLCKNCGAQIQTETNSSTFEDQVAQPSTQQTPPSQIPPQSSAPPPQQQIGQKQANVPMSQKKSNNRLIATIVVIVVVIVIIAIIYFLIGGSDSRFVGEWEQEGIQVIWTFYNDGSFESMGVEGTWRVDGEKFCIKTDILGEFTGEICYDYEFSDNGNTLTLKNIGVLTKK
jgi:hypothetical protein